MKRILLSAIATISIANFAYANKTSIIKKTNGYVRLGYQNDTKGNVDLAIGGKLHVETKEWNYLSAGLSFYTTHIIGGLNDEAGVPFFGSNNQSYSILGEAYIKWKFKNTLMKIGRQELDTPYADTDDVGMVPNTFEAALIQNKDIENTTVTAAYINNMAGVDASVPEKFTDDGMSDGVYAIGVNYKGIENLELQGWYYSIQDKAGDRAFTYFDTTYDVDKENITYKIGAQFATQEAFKNDPDKDAKIYGISVSGGYKPSGITLTMAYNKDSGTAADNGFGGGPFYTSAEQLTLSEAGADGKVYALSGEWDASSVGIEGVTIGAGYFLLKSKADNKAHENDVSISYDYSDNLGFSAVYSNINDNINNENFKNIRGFVNYKF